MNSCSIEYVINFYKIELRKIVSDFTNFFSVVLADSVLAFHKHGMQGRSFKNGDITQEICDRTRIFKLLGSDR